MTRGKKFLASLCWYSGIGPFLRVFREPEEVIIAYHSIWDPDNPTDSNQYQYDYISIEKKAFLQQIEYLESRGYTFARFGDVGRNKGKVAYIYFDDGFRDVLQIAYPILKSKNIPATFFITIDYINQKSLPNRYLTWDELQTMKGFFEIGSHSLSHQKLNKLSPTEAEQEMKDSKVFIEQKLNVSVSSFSYPKGRSSKELEVIAKRVGYITTTADKRFKKIRPDPDDTMTIFKWKTII